MNEITHCSVCGCVLDDDNECYEVDDQLFCQDCCDNETTVCDCCGGRCLEQNTVSDNNTTICTDCYNDCYNRCSNCDSLVHSDDTYWRGENPYCRDCYDECCGGDDYINDYYYKPKPVFYTMPKEAGVRFYGVELEIDGGGRYDENAEKLYDIANAKNDVIYIKSDGSLDEGMELVSHPCSINFHRKKLPWGEIVRKALSLGYSSHNTSTCGLHVHIGRKQLGETIEEQEEVISRIMFFFESHWNELFKFSRRTSYSADRWAARHGYNDKPKEILEKAKKSTKGRYACVNITNTSTVEIRLFRGTLKLGSFMAVLELVDSICENAVYLTDDELHRQSWADFVMNINPEYTELIRYLKEKRLYVNEPVNNENNEEEE